MFRRVSHDPLDRSRFPIDEWNLIETSPSAEGLGVTETLFAVGNGYLGLRGNPEEGRDSVQHGTFINGFHETWPIRHAEAAYGFARTGQTIVNVPDSKTMKIYVDDEPLLLAMADLASYERRLDLRAGLLRRSLVWRTPAGKRVRIASTRMVSFTDRHLALMELEVTMLDGDAPVVVSSQILNRQDGFTDYHRPTNGDAPNDDPRRAGELRGRVLAPELQWRDDERMILGWRTANSGMTLAVAADHQIVTSCDVEPLISAEPDLGKRVYRVEARQGESIVIRKAVTYHSSRSVPVRELSDRCRRTLDRVRDRGFEHYQREQRRWLDEFWHNSDVVIGGQPALQQATRWCLFQVAQAAARSDQRGIPAKGVTGDGYEGHYFWDTETYVVPFLTYTNPRLARNALRFRVTSLPQARERARELSQRGALYPWRTINGEEASAYYAAGTAQYHIDADVAHAFTKYADVTGDSEFMLREGALVLVETARLWADLGFWRETDDCETFHIYRVTGPDEYTTVVNDNMFTNVMAQANLRRAASLMRDMRHNHAAEFADVVRKTGLEPDEIDEWERCAEGMCIPFDPVVGIHPQDDQFLGSELWDLENTPDDKRPLLLHYHPLVIYRFQVLKQADVVLALFLQGDGFSAQEKRADFEYYDPITTGDSSLSAVVQSIIAAEVGYQDMAMEYFRAGVYIDLADLHANTRDGVHIASMGGVWNALVAGFGGMRDYGGRLSFDPRLPADWAGLQFALRVRGSRLEVDLAPDAITLTVSEGEPVEVSVRGFVVTVGDQGVRIPLDDQGPRLSSLDASHPIVGGRREDGSLITAEVPDSPDWVGWSGLD